VNWSFGLWHAAHLLFPSKGSVYARKRMRRVILLIALVMAPLVVAFMFTGGMIEGITQKYISLQDGHLQLYDSQPLELNSDYIISADYVVGGQGIIYSRSATSEVTIKGVDASYFQTERSAQLHYSTPVFTKTGSTASVMISRNLSEKLEVEKGQRLAFMVLPDSSKAVIRPVLATVTSIYESGYRELDDHLVFMDREDAQRYFVDPAKAYTEVLATKEGAKNLPLIVEQAQKVAGKPLSYASWDEFNQLVYQNFITSKQVIFVVFILILIVASVYVGSIAFEMVEDNKQEIAMLKILGATDATLRFSFFTTIMGFTTTAVVVGAGCGVYIGSHLKGFLNWVSSLQLAAMEYYLLDFPTLIVWKDILFLCAAMVLISSITTFGALRRIQKVSALELLQQD